MSVDEKKVESFAEAFYHYHSALAPDFGCGAAREIEWDDLSCNERKRLVAAARLALLQIEEESSGRERQVATPNWRNGTEGRKCGC
jgi:hypothetical protein